jgi:hypothetical protein
LSTDWALHVGALSRALAQNDAVRAAEAASRMAAMVASSQGAVGELPPTLWDPLVGLLDARGYYVAAPAQLSTSLREIHRVGEGFDLYELCRALAQCDAAITDCLKASPARAFPALAPFAPRCGCRVHRSGGKA